MKRPLPWRETRDPYALLVSEVMLQQTQAARVVPYYERFLARFPDPRALAAARAGDVLKAWSGLGYNRRALALHAAARAVTARGWPDDLTELPGVGPYTAAAVGSFAWDRAERRRSTPTSAACSSAATASCAPARDACRARGFARSRPAARRVQPGHDGARRDGLPARARRAAPDARSAMRGAGGRRDHAPPPRRPRFEDTDRWARGRILAALLAGDEPPPAIDGERRERVLAGLERDGLIVRAADGSARLPEDG